MKLNKEQVLSQLVVALRKALESKDWRQVERLDVMLCKVISLSQSSVITVREKQLFGEVNALYSELIGLAESEKSKVKLLLQEQQDNHQGLQAYLRNK